MRAARLLLSLQIGAGVNIVSRLALAQSDPPIPSPSISTTLESRQTSSSNAYVSQTIATAWFSSSYSSSSSINFIPDGFVIPAPTSLSLPVSSSPPDPLGISQVSDVYGPGTWAAWFLTIVGSWVGVFRASKKKVNMNTTLFLIGTNWAAVDVFRSIHTFRSIHPDQPNYEADILKGMGSYAAAFTVVFWGTFHIILQAWLTLLLDNSNSSDLRRRFPILVLGLVLPLTALTVTAFGPLLYCLGRFSLDLFPSLYWKGMGSDTHITLVLFAAWTGILLVAFSIIIICYVWQLRDRTKSRIVTTILYFWGSGSVLLFSVSIILWNTTNSNIYIWGMSPFFLFFSPVLLGAGMAIWTVWIPASIVVYIFKAYLRLGSNASESCFLMPCAPQSIKEEGQLYSLLAGLFSLFAFDILPPIFGKLRRRYKE